MLSQGTMKAIIEKTYYETNDDIFIHNAFLLI